MNSDSNDGAARLEAALRALHAGRPDAAIEQLEPVRDSPEQRHAPLYHLAHAYFEAGRPEAAVEAIEHFLAVEPPSAAAHALAARFHAARDAWASAEAHLRRAVMLEPRAARTNVLLVETLVRLARSEEALELARRARDWHALTPALAARLGTHLVTLKAHEEAFDWLRRGLATDHPSPRAQRAMATLLRAQGRHDQAQQFDRLAADAEPVIAAVAARRALTAAMSRLDYLLQRPDIGSEAGIGRFARNQAQLQVVRGALARYEALAPRCAAEQRLPEDQHATIWYTLGGGHLECGEIEAALTAFRRALDLDPSLHIARSDLLLTLNYRLADPHAVYGEHRAQARHWPAAGPLPPRTGRNERLRVGYVSADFRQHSIACFVAPLFAAHSRARVEVFAYSNLATPDSTTARLRAQVEHWRDIAALDDAAARDLIVGDAIDVLVDLSGHTALGRLGPFAMRAAPVQVSWLGYPNTTGLTSMDCRLVDAITDPPGAADACHTEALIRLPRTFLCYEPPPDAPAVSSPAFERNGCITFGSFNHFAKMGDSALACWASVLASVPESRLVLKNAAVAAVAIRARLHDFFAARGIDPARIELRPMSPERTAHLEQYTDIDIALDTFPYCGTTTTCEALWMGVPVVTLAGDVHAARVGASLLSNLGHADLVATAADNYVSRVVALAADRACLAQLRAQLRPRMRDSSLTDARGFAEALEGTLMGVA